MTTLAIRPFEPGDAAPVTRLLHAAYAELGARGMNYTAVDQDEATTLARANGGHCLVAVRGEAILGTLTITLPPGPELRGLTPIAREPRRGWLNQVAVAPDARGLGIARSLWAAGRSWAHDAGARSIGVDTAIPAEHLVRLYEGWGFEAVDEIRWPGKRYRSIVLELPLSGDPPPCDGAPAARPRP